jgi:hypothetical protein
VLVLVELGGNEIGNALDLVVSSCIGVAVFAVFSHGHTGYGKGGYQ